VDVATTVVNQDIWLVLAQAQLVQAQFQVLVVVLVPRAVDMVEDSYPVEGLLVDLALLLVTSAVGQTTLPETAKLKP